MTNAIQQQRELFKCPGCGDNLAVKKGDTFIMMNTNKGQHMPVELEIQNPAGSPVRLACGKCKRTSAIFVTIRHESYIQKEKRGVEN